MHRLFSRCFACLVAFAATSSLVVAGPLAAQSSGGVVRGGVAAAGTRAPIVGARVSVGTPSRAAITDERGA